MVHLIIDMREPDCLTQDAHFLITSFNYFSMWEKNITELFVPGSPVI